MRKICDLCKEEITLANHPTGLVVNNQFFACSNCCENKPEQELRNWVYTKLGGGNNLRPIFQWLREQQNMRNY
ncbi:hypothetical protein JW930_02335 [Candidatus Woesearchaeota archaeon]|nr:hypothetical protein [Candidatus Woesearchaeota archaeon]